MTDKKVNLNKTKPTEVKEKKPIEGSVETPPISTLDVKVPTDQTIKPEMKQISQPEPQVDPGETNDLTPTEVKESQQKAGIFETEPPPVREAEARKDPAFWKKAMGYGTGWLPVVGKLTSQPLIQAYEERGRKVGKDKEMIGMFWKAMEKDPVYAKQLIRVPTIRDALQRTHGMSGEEILDLDKGITEEGVMSRQQFIQTMMKQGLQPEGGYQTEFGDITTPPEPPEKQVGRFKEMAGVIVDTTTGEPARDLNKQKFDSILTNVQKYMSKLGPEEQFLTALGLSSKDNKMARAKPTVLAGGKGLYIEDRFSGVGRIIKTGFGEESNWQAEAYSSEGIPGVYDGILVYDKTAENPQDTATILRFDETLMPDGTTARQRLDVERARLANEKADEGTTRDAVLKMISRFMGFFTQDNSPGMGIAGQGGQTTQQQGGVIEAPLVVEPGPGRIRPAATTDVDVGKQNKFFGTSNKLIGD